MSKKEIFIRLASLIIFIIITVLITIVLGLNSGSAFLVGLVSGTLSTLVSNFILDRIGIY
jgi:hypothetical protein